MIQLNENERGRLQKLTQDKVTLEGLKKVFLNSVLRDETIQEVNV